MNIQKFLEENNITTQIHHIGVSIEDGIQTNEYKVILNDVVIRYHTIKEFDLGKFMYDLCFDYKYYKDYLPSQYGTGFSETVATVRAKVELIFTKEQIKTLVRHMVDS